jgi:serine/threonine protein kinase
MSLSAGTKLGPYEIQSLLGAGGMGEVYRANDTRLDRTVAIKVLPSHLSSDPDRIQRFEREARTISSLNHPHICTLYDVGTQNSVTFLVMEFLEGVTLAHRLMRGALPIIEVLQIGREVADALSKAHHLGIVHRDLKPGNIMLTKSGAKLMDFGLAKPSLGTSASVGGALTPATPTLSLPSLTSPTSPLTQKGHVLGTFQYMSPEQLQGCEADARSDIFAFGAVLYEMTTGRRAFEGKSQLSVITAILEKEPEPVSSLQKASPLALDHVITTCLAKNPDDRWQTAHDVKLQLQWVQAVGSQSGISLPIVKQKRGMTALAWSLAAALAIGCALATVAYLRISGKPTNALVAFIPPPENHIRVFGRHRRPTRHFTGRTFLSVRRADGGQKPALAACSRFRKCPGSG